MVFTWGLLIPFASMNTIIHVPTNIMFPRKQTMTEKWYSKFAVRCEFFLHQFAPYNNNTQISEKLDIISFYQWMYVWSSKKWNNPSLFLCFNNHQTFEEFSVFKTYIVWFVQTLCALCVLLQSLSLENTEYLLKFPKYLPIPNYMNVKH